MAKDSYPRAAKIHHYGPAVSKESIAYREKLGNVSATAETADSVLNVATDPRKMIGLILLLVFVCAVVYLVRKQVKDVLLDVWNKVMVEPFSSWRTIKDTEAAGGTVGEVNINASSIANAMKGSFGLWNDDEDTIEACLRQIHNDSEWIAVYNAFGEPTLKTPDHPWAGVKLRLNTALVKFSNASELSRYRNILLGNGVSQKVFDF